MIAFGAYFSIPELESELPRSENRFFTFESLSRIGSNLDYEIGGQLVIEIGLEDIPKSESPEGAAENENGERKWGHPPDLGSGPAINFYRQHALDAQFVVGEKIILDAFDKTMTAILSLILPDAPPREEFPNQFKMLDELQSRVDHNGEVRSELIVTRYVDNYLVYLADLLSLILCEMPKEVQVDLVQSLEALSENLKGGLSIKFEEVLTFKSIDELIRWMAEKKVQSLSREGFFSMARYFKTVLNLDLVSDAKRTKELVRAISTRNLLVHKRGIIDSKYIGTLQDAGIDVTDYKIGSRVDLKWPAWVPKLVWESVVDLERQAQERFTVPVESVGNDGWWVPTRHEAIEESVS